MSFNNSNNRIIGILLTLILSIIIYGNFYYQNKISEAENEIEKLKQNEKLKENENLKLKENLNELKNENRKLKEELEKYNNLRKLNIVATAYDAFCDTGCIGVTATGYDVANTVYKDGFRVIAVDPNVIPLGSILYIETSKGNILGIAEDTGGAIKGNRVDILMENRERAYDFGVQNVKVTVLREGDGA